MRVKIFIFSLLFFGGIIPLKTFSTEKNVSLSLTVAPLARLSYLEGQLLVETNTEQMLLIQEKNGERQVQPIENYFLQIPFDPESFYTVIAGS